MKRIDDLSLEYKDGRFYYDETLFDGIAFKIMDGIIEEKKRYENGVMLGDYHSFLLEDSENPTWMESDMLVGDLYEDEEPFLYRGSLYSGMAVEMNGHVCIREIYLVRGEVRGEIIFNPSGGMDQLYHHSQSLLQNFHWDDEGLLKRIRLQALDVFRVEFEFIHGNTLTSADIRGDYFATLSDLKPNLKCPVPIDSLEFSSHVSVHSDVILTALGISDSFFEELKKCTGFDGIERIVLFHTKVRGRNIEKLGQLPHIRNIVISDQREELIIEAKEIKRANGQCSVIFNDMDLT